MKLAYPLEQQLLHLSHARSIHSTELIQSLWSGYGQLLRVHLDGGQWPSVIVKHIQFPETSEHPRGWSSTIAHQRKLNSYQVECHWYQHVASQCPKASYVPSCYAVTEQGKSILLVLEDLTVTGYSDVVTRIEWDRISTGIRWLAHFHARFMGDDATGLWSTGTYWHLDTRPHEFAAMSDGRLKQAARALDHQLSRIPFQTLVHGDAKLANFCFSPGGDKVAAVDFQYVGKGCGMKDLMLFVTSSVLPDHCWTMEQQILDYYFSELSHALALYKPGLDARAIETAWRPMYPLAWADYNRFLNGWSPHHSRINDYSRHQTDIALQWLDEQGARG